MRCGAIVAGCAIFWGCSTVQVFTFPAPDADCATDADVMWLRDQFPPMLTLDQQQILTRVVDSVAYCQTAERML